MTDNRPGLVRNMATIRDYWADRGHHVTLSIEAEEIIINGKVEARGVGIKSDMIGGMPRTADAELVRLLILEHGAD